MHIISVPTIFSCKLPNGNWLNLAQVRQLEPDPPTGVVVITWVNGDTSRLDGENAKFILKTWQEAHQKSNNYRQRNRRK